MPWLPPSTQEPTATWFDTPLGRQVWAEEESALLSLIDGVADLRVLDAGCGDGRFAAVLSKAGARVVGIDLDANMLRAAEVRISKGETRAQLVRADIHRIPFANDTIDVVVAVTTLCFVAKPAEVASEFARVLRPGGRIIVGELGRWSPWATGRRLRGWRTGGPWRNARFWTRADLAKLLDAAGLTVAAMNAAVFYPRSERLARLFTGVSRSLGRRFTIGAAFIAVAGTKSPR